LSLSSPNETLDAWETAKGLHLPNATVSIMENAWQDWALHRAKPQTREQINRERRNLRRQGIPRVFPRRIHSEVALRVPGRTEYFDLVTNLR
jgi:hypothetical protein